MDISRSLGFLLVASALSAFSFPAIADSSSSSTIIPPVVLQGCNTTDGTSGNEVGAAVVGFDLSFVNTTDKLAKLVLLRIGERDFVKVGTFSPGAVVSWHLDAPAGSACFISAVRFEDGSEWTAPPEATGPTPLPLNAPLPGVWSSSVPSTPQPLPFPPNTPSP